VVHAKQASRKETSPEAAKAAEELSELGELGWPETGGQAERRSLSFQLGRREETAAPANLAAAEAQVVARYPRTPAPRLDTIESIRERMEALAKTVSPKSSPGYPYNRFGSTNREVMEKMGTSIIERATLRLVLLRDFDPEELRALTPSDYVRLGLSDPGALFVKKEPHSKEKITQGRWRLIIAVSLVDQLVMRYLCHWQNAAEIELWEHVPSKPGIGFTDEQMTKFVATMRELKYPTASDASGWDFSVQQWELDSEARMRLQIMRNPSPECVRAVTNAYTVLGGMCFLDSDGNLYEQTVRGIMKSGTYVTSSSNSRIRVLAATLVGAAWCVAMGDDALEQFTENAIENYARLGHRIKFYELCGNHYDFCSHKISRASGTAELSSWPKSLFKLLHQNGTPEEKEGYLEQFRYVLRHHPRLPEFEAVIARAGWLPRN
jgi:hypothetical protein